MLGGGGGDEGREILFMVRGRLGLCFSMCLFLFWGGGGGSNSKNRFTEAAWHRMCQTVTEGEQVA